ncbi:Acetolactate synthase, mitochondrial [Brettanomyces bruxellensis]|uniref:Acetolactate synthase n=1 Tax=Dekkera bruxellensis TaxID=5007 RepID=A0A871R3M5_DEKBR|nr:Acetolactate synthase, mitochondrial [Brettanomyces bruxellensis]QOU21397.1 Acetolactate synthase, mitochondrial [Brettanomyces bruxellensis]
MLSTAITRSTRRAALNLAKTAACKSSGHLSHTGAPLRFSQLFAARYRSTAHNVTREQPAPAFNAPSATENVDDVEAAAEAAAAADHICVQSADEAAFGRHSHPLDRKIEMDSSMIGMTGGEIFHEMMVRHKVDTVFGYPGGAILPVYDAIYNSKQFNFVLPRHEQGAGHMAEGYARVSGNPGVVLVTSGPGATNTVTAMTDALADGVPMVVFTGQVPTSAIGTDAFQEADVVGISRSCTKWNVMVKSVSELPRRINEAFEIATTGRPGPVLVDLPKDVTSAILRHAIPTSSTIPNNTLATLTRSAITRFTAECIQRAADLVNKAKKPVLYVGAGILNNEDGPKRLKELADKAKIPVTTTLEGLGAFDQRDEKSLDMLGMHGAGAANMAIQKADLIIALGTRFDDRVTGNVSKFAPQARLAASEGRGGIIHFEISPKNINKVVEATEAIEGDVTQNLELFNELVEPVESRPEWFSQIREWKQKYPYAYEHEVPGGPIKPQTVIKEIDKQSRATGRDIIIATGVGQHQMWTAQYVTWTKPHSFVTSGGLGTMGFGLPAAIGAQVAKPESIVIDIDGDASFNMTLMELSSAVQANAPVKIVILNNEEQGMVTQWQSLFYKHRYSHTHQHNPNFVGVAEAMGLKALRVSKQEDLKPSIAKLLAYNQGPILLEVKVEHKTPVLPMVPSGKGLDEFITYNPEFIHEQNALRHKRNNGRFD